jgi:hypothetical protein
VIPLHSNDRTQAQSIESLAAGWQELARRLRLFELGGTPVDEGQAEILRQLIQRSGEMLRSLPVRGGDAPHDLRNRLPQRQSGLPLELSACPLAEGRIPPAGFQLPPSRSHTLLLTGSEQLLSAQDLIALLAGRALTGTLEFKTERETFTLEFDGGTVAHMHTNTATPGERLGELIAQRGVLGAREVEEARRGKRRGRIGELLLANNSLTEDQLRFTLESQIHVLIGRLCEARSFRFVFWQGPLLLALPSLRIDVSALLLTPLPEELGTRPAA